MDKIMTYTNGTTHLKSYVSAKQVMVTGECVATHDNTVRVNTGTDMSLQEVIKDLRERMKRLEDDFVEHILLRQTLVQVEKKSE